MPLGVFTIDIDRMQQNKLRRDNSASAPSIPSRYPQPPSSARDRQVRGFYQKADFALLLPRRFADNISSKKKNLSQNIDLSSSSKKDKTKKKTTDSESQAQESSIVTFTPKKVMRENGGTSLEKGRRNQKEEAVLTIAKRMSHNAYLPFKQRSSGWEKGSSGPYMTSRIPQQHLQSEGRENSTEEGGYKIDVNIASDRRVFLNFPTKSHDKQEEEQKGKSDQEDITMIPLHQLRRGTNVFDSPDQHLPSAASPRARRGTLMPAENLPKKTVVKIIMSQGEEQEQVISDEKVEWRENNIPKQDSTNGGIVPHPQGVEEPEEGESQPGEIFGPSEVVENSNRYSPTGGAMRNPHQQHYPVLPHPPMDFLTAAANFYNYATPYWITPNGNFIIDHQQEGATADKKNWKQKKGERNFRQSVSKGIEEEQKSVVFTSGISEALITPRQKVKKSIQQHHPSSGLESKLTACSSAAIIPSFRAVRKRMDDEAAQKVQGQGGGKGSIDHEKGEEMLMLAALQKVGQTPRTWFNEEVLPVVNKAPIVLRHGDIVTHTTSCSSSSDPAVHVPPNSPSKKNLHKHSAVVIHNVLNNLDSWLERNKEEGSLRVSQNSTHPFLQHHRSPYGGYYNEEAEGYAVVYPNMDYKKALLPPKFIAPSTPRRAYIVQEQKRLRSMAATKAAARCTVTGAMGWVDSSQSPNSTDLCSASRNGISRLIDRSVTVAIDALARPNSVPYVHPQRPPPTTNRSEHALNHSLQSNATLLITNNRATTGHNENTLNPHTLDSNDGEGEGAELEDENPLPEHPVYEVIAECLAIRAEKKAEKLRCRLEEMED